MRLVQGCAAEVSPADIYTFGVHQLVLEKWQGNPFVRHTHAPPPLCLHGRRWLAMLVYVG